MSDTIIRTCIVCKCEYETLKKYQEYQDAYPMVTWKWRLEYCEPHRKERIEQAFKRLPEIIDTLIKQGSTTH